MEPAYQALERGDYDRVMALCDSLQEHSSVSAVELNLLRATVCLRTKRHRSGEVYLKKAVASFSGQDIELGVYASASYKLGQLLNDKGDYKDAVKTVASAIDLLEEHKGNIYTYASNLLICIRRWVPVWPDWGMSTRPMRVSARLSRHIRTPMPYTISTPAKSKRRITATRNRPLCRR